ncbi:MAG: flagellar basal body P-ring formation chaperone FlgA [Phenylobacterium sp.]|nr:flagellar basal body P-ring formation chaperone FlgA [Phenylobacterium sp.]MDP1875341.1 flagellar basal body P-ring formation chaperone FlgA [Phenylobacterium sp.]MDP3491070.1 flagellar basal body P-ring formation chaperone FlgA [Phenylobacterium sp.]
MILRHLTIAAALWLAAAPIAQAAQPVSLKAETVDSDGVVTLGDLFDGAGSAAAVRVAAKPGLSVVLDAGAVQQLARRAGLHWANAEGVRRIVVRTGADSGTATSVSARAGNVEVLTYARSLSTGDIVQPEDLIWGKAAMAPTDAPHDAEAIIGLAARRPLRAGSVVAARDVTAPQVIAAGDIVTLTYEAAGMVLSVKAKAMGRAAQGEGFAAQNLTTKRTVQAVATGPGQAAVGPGADQMLASPAARYALR